MKKLVTITNMELSALLKHAIAELTAVLFSLFEFGLAAECVAPGKIYCQTKKTFLWWDHGKECPDSKISKPGAQHFMDGDSGESREQPQPKRTTPRRLSQQSLWIEPNEGN